MAYNHYFAKPAAKPAAPAAKPEQKELALRDQIPAIRPAICLGLMAGCFCAPMNAQRLVHAIDQISYWSGKAFAWLIVAADPRDFRGGLQALHP